MTRSPTRLFRTTHHRSHGIPTGGLHASLAHHRLLFAALAAAVLVGVLASR